jgi:hypothetical protein
MELTLITTLTTLAGVFFGLNINNFLQRMNAGNLKLKEVPAQNFKSKKNLIVQKLRLDDLEIRFLNSITAAKDNRIFVEDLNQLLKLVKLTTENQRQRRHVFLKELNIKLSLHFNDRECIVRIPSELDARKKMYAINENIDRKLIGDIAL